MLWHFEVDNITNHIHFSARVAMVLSIEHHLLMFLTGTFRGKMYLL